MCDWCDKDAAKAPRKHVQTIGYVEFLPQKEYDKDISSALGPLTQGIYHEDPEQAVTHRDSLVSRKSVNRCRSYPVEINLN